MTGTARCPLGREVRKRGSAQTHSEVGTLDQGRGSGASLTPAKPALVESRGGDGPSLNMEGGRESLVETLCKGLVNAGEPGQDLTSLCTLSTVGASMPL
ncbi:hypothetical protein INR49_002848 [Caranx melampygus]|nr:hypothetical protein INR49_002848 [Caranx melampygus]